MTTLLLSISSCAGRRSSFLLRATAFLPSTVVCLSCFVLSAPRADGSEQVAGSASTDIVDVASEDQLIAAVREAALYDNETLAETRLASLGGLVPDAPLSVALARRTAGVCGWLQSERGHARAERLARRTLQRLAALDEDNDVDRVERLYWEAWIEGYVLDDKVRALGILQVAAELAPDDLRISSDIARWAQAVAEFGR